MYAGGITASSTIRVVGCLGRRYTGAEYSTLTPQEPAPTPALPDHLPVGEKNKDE